MKSGAINIVTEAGQSLSAESAPLERQEEGRTLRSTVQLNGYAQTTLNDITVKDDSLNATPIAEGTVLRDELADVKIQRVNRDGKLEVSSEGKEIQVDETRFIHVEDQILLTEKTGADGARNIIEALSSSTIEEAHVDIPSFTAAHPEADSVLEWARGEEGAICAIDDFSTKEEIRKHIDASERAQMSFKYLEWNGRSLYGTVTRSGYVDLYRDENGSRISTEEFAQFVLQEIMDHATLPD